MVLYVCAARHDGRMSSAGVSIVSGASGAIDAIHYCTINAPLCQAQNAHFSRVNCDKELIYLAVLAYSSVFQKRSSDIRRSSLHLKTESCLILFVINNIHFIIYIFNLTICIYFLPIRKSCAYNHSIFFQYTNKI